MSYLEVLTWLFQERRWVFISLLFILYCTLRVLYNNLGSLTDQHAQSTAKMGTHRGRCRWTLCELPWKTRHNSRVHPAQIPRFSCLLLDVSLGQCVPPICMTLHTTTHLLLAMWKLIFYTKLKPSYLGTSQEQSLKVWSVWLEEMVARSPTAGLHSATFISKTHLLLGRQTSHCEEMKKTTHLYFTSITRSLMLSPYVFKPQTS